MTVSADEVIVELESRLGPLGTPLAVLLTGSYARGWNNAGSDIDLTVIVEGPLSVALTSSLSVALVPDWVPTDVFDVRGRRWDVQLWTVGQVDQMLSKVSWEEFDSGPHSGSMVTNRESTFMERLSYAVPLSGAEWLRHQRDMLEKSALRTMNVTRSVRHCDLYIEDLYGQLQVGDTESAVLSAKLAFHCAIRALLARHGKHIHSPKWFARQMRDLSQNVLSFDQYWAVETMRGYRAEQPTDWVENVVRLCRVIIREVHE